MSSTITSAEDTMVYGHSRTMRGETKELVVAIEYHPRRASNGGIIYTPHSVFTVDMKTKRHHEVYDFDWCERDESIYQHNSGSGGRFYMSPIVVQSRKEPRACVWWNREVTYPTNANLAARRLSVETLKRWGYTVLKEPMFIGEGCATRAPSINPFDVAYESETEYCDRCKDLLPVDNLCEHIWWCEKCGTFSAPGERCKHRRPQYA